MNFTFSTYNEIMASPVGSGRPEQGGVLFSSDGGLTIDKFVYDKEGSCSGVTYSPNVKFINEQIRYYNNRGYYFIGCIHSHPRGYTSISFGRGYGSGYTSSDEEAIIKLLNGMKGTKRLYFPVVQSSYHGEFSMRLFFGEKGRDGNISIYEDHCIHVVDDVSKDSMRREIQGYIPINKYTHSTAVIVGAGNGFDLAEQLTRIGVNKFVLIDSTRYEPSDISGFATYENIGGYKADAVARKIRSINPIAQVRIIRQSIDEEIDNKRFACWLENVDRKRSIVIFCEGAIDDFKETQKLCSVNKIALIRGYSEKGYHRSSNWVYTDFYDYWADSYATRKRKMDYVSNYFGPTLPTNAVLISKINDFFTCPTGKKERKAVARSEEKQVPLAQKYEPLYTKEEISRKKVVVIGCGGSMSYIENLVRSGIEHLTLIDADRYCLSNIQTQMAYFNDLEQFKVDVAAERISLINPEVKVTTVKKMLDENMTDEEFADYVGQEWIDRPNDVLIAACTDNFIAQARCSRLALKFGFPYIQAGIYPGGRILELAFFHPLVSKVCPRCMLSSRYKANLENKVKPEPAKSNGTSIFFTEQLNSLKGFISLALLLYHSETADKRFSDFMDDNGWVTPKRARKIDRNYLFFTMDSKLAEHTGRKAYVTFDKWGQKMGSNYQIGVSFFRKRKPEKHCPDCGGKGNLLIHVKGTIADTRDGLYKKEE